MTAVRVCARHRTPLRERGDALVCGEREVLTRPAGPRRQHSAATKRRMAAAQRKRRARERREATA